MNPQEKIISMALSGPVLPAQVAKALNTDTLMAAAFLSELASKGALKVSSLKVGSSPLYYVADKKEQLLNYLTHLDSKDQKTVSLLKQKKVLKDTDVEPLTRVSLRKIRDFAIPLEVTRNNHKSLYWKWYLVEDKEAQALIQKMLSPAKSTPPPAPKTTRKSIKSTKAAFETLVLDYFKSNNISIQEKLKDGFIVEVDSPVGALTYYCHPKAKKRVSDADISNAYVQAQMHKIPALFVTTGKLTKKAEALLQSLRGVKVAYIGSKT